MTPSDVIPFTDDECEAVRSLHRQWPPTTDEGRALARLLATIARDEEIARLRETDNPTSRRHFQHRAEIAEARVVLLEAALRKAKTYVDECFKHEHYRDGVMNLAGQLIGAQQTIDAALKESA